MYVATHLRMNRNTKITNATCQLVSTTEIILFYTINLHKHDRKHIEKLIEVVELITEVQIA